VLLATLVFLSKKEYFILTFSDAVVVVIETETISVSAVIVVVEVIPMMATNVDVGDAAEAVAKVKKNPKK